MKNIFLLLSIFIINHQLQAQITADALLFSELHPTTTARSMGLGNSLGALGGDMSAANMNPAGMAVYRRTEFALSIGGLFDNTTTTFLDNKTPDKLGQLSFGNIGMLFAARIDNRKNKWKGVNFGLTVNRLANYARDFTYDGLSTGSRIQSFAENAQGYGIDELDVYEGWVAYNSYLIDSVAPYTYAPNGGVSDTTFTSKYQNVKRLGGVNELGLSIGGNFDNKLYLAATIGVSFMNMEENRLYQEDSDYLDFYYLDFIESRVVKGTGINLKLGMIYRINKMFRMGLAVHTPTAYRLVDSYNTGLAAKILYNGLLQESNYKMEDQDPYVLQHNLATPWVFMGSFAAVIAKQGFINLDVEYTDYGWASFSLLKNEQTSANNKFINDLNQRVGNAYKGVLKARIGGEVAIGLARIRVGYQLQTAPYKVAVTDLTDLRHDISAGFGLRWKHFFLDIAYMHTLKDFEYNPYYSSSTSQRITGASQTGHFMLTLGASVFRDK